MCKFTDYTLVNYYTFKFPVFLSYDVRYPTVPVGKVWGIDYSTVLNIVSNLYLGNVSTNNSFLGIEYLNIASGNLIFKVLEESISIIKTAGCNV